MVIVKIFVMASCTCKDITDSRPRANTAILLVLLGSVGLTFGPENGTIATSKCEATGRQRPRVCRLSPSRGRVHIAPLGFGADHGPTDSTRRFRAFASHECKSASSKHPDSPGVLGAFVYPSPTPVGGWRMNGETYAASPNARSWHDAMRPELPAARPSERWCRRLSPDLGSKLNSVDGNTHCQIHSSPALGYFLPSASGTHTPGTFTDRSISHKRFTSAR